MENETLKEQLAKRLRQLETVRDEIRVDLHLASMDLRDEWAALERKLPTAGELKAATGEAIDRLTAELRRFRERLRSAGRS